MSWLVLAIVCGYGCGADHASANEVTGASASDGAAESWNDAASPDRPRACADGGFCRPASQGSASLHLQGPSKDDAATDKRCPSGAHYVDAPSASNSSQRTTGSTRPPDAIVDEQQGCSLQCSVTPSAGGKFAISARIEAPAFDENHFPLPTPVRIGLQTTIGKDESGAPGTLIVSDDLTAGQIYESASCSFSVKMNPPAEARLAIDSGKVWGSVVCSNLVDPSDPSTSCEIDTGYFLLENCVQE